MASSSEIIDDSGTREALGLTVKGDLGELRVVDDSDSEDNDGDVIIGSNSTKKALETLSNTIPAQKSAPALPNNFYISASENIQVGDNHHFHGPVVIKQVFKNRGIDNASYTKTDNEHGSALVVPKSDLKSSSEKTVTVPPWLKVTISVTSVGVLGIICALVFIIQNHTQDDKPHSDTDTDPPGDEPNYTKVVGLCYDNLQIIVLTMIVMPITIMYLLYSLLTKTVYKQVRKEEQSDSSKSLAIYPQGDFNASIEKPKPKDDPLLISQWHLRIVSRSDWLAQPVEAELSKIRQPVPWVVITHTATEGCSTQSECVLRVRLIQMFHIESRQWADIGYNFLVAGDGSAYFGRGWDHIGAHTLGYNKYSIGIAFVGTFNTDAPQQKQIEACQKLIKLGVQLGKISKDYKLFAHRQLASTLSPGDKLYNIIKEWPHFVKEDTNITELVPQDY